MNLIGKIFVVMITVMSLVFMAFSVMVYATHKNWMATINRSQQEVKPGEPLGLIAGNGDFPLLVLEGARRRGVDMAVIAIREGKQIELKVQVGPKPARLEPQDDGAPEEPRRPNLRNRGFRPLP